MAGVIRVVGTSRNCGHISIYQSRLRSDSKITNTHPVERTEQLSFWLLLSAFVGRVLHARDPCSTLPPLGDGIWGEMGGM